MIATKAKGKCAAWAAMLGIALNVLWPLLAALGPGVPDPAIGEVCTADGLVAVYEGGPQRAVPRDPARRLTPHCALCNLASDHAAPQSAGLRDLTVEAARPLRPAGRPIAVIVRSSFVPYGVRSPPA